jgi:hypothetical protein
VVTVQSLESVLGALRVPAARSGTPHSRAEHVSGRAGSGERRGWIAGCSKIVPVGEEAPPPPQELF